MEREIQKIKDQILNLLSYRDRSCYELKERLLKKGYQEENINQAISHLLKLGYLNDEEFASKWVKSRIKHRPRGRNLLKKELYSKGVDQEIVDKVVNNLVDDYQELETGISLAKKWIISHERDINKLKRYLYNKGFSITLINKIILSIREKEVW